MVAANLADALLPRQSGSGIHQTCSSPGAYLKPGIAIRGMDCKANASPHSIPPGRRLGIRYANLFFRHEGRRADARQDGSRICNDQRRDRT